MLAINLRQQRHNLVAWTLQQRNITVTAVFTIKDFCEDGEKSKQN